MRSARGTQKRAKKLQRSFFLVSVCAFFWICLRVSVRVTHNSKQRNSPKTDFCVPFRTIFCQICVLRTIFFLWGPATTMLCENLAHNTISAKNRVKRCVTNLFLVILLFQVRNMNHSCNTCATLWQRSSHTKRKRKPRSFSPHQEKRSQKIPFFGYCASLHFLFKKTYMDVRGTGQIAFYAKKGVNYA